MQPVAAELPDRQKPLADAIEDESASNTTNVLGAFQRQRLVAKKSVSRQGETGGNVLSRN